MSSNIFVKKIKLINRRSSFLLLASFLSISLFGCTDDLGEDFSQDEDSIPFHYTASIYANIPGLGSCEGKSFQGFAVYNDVAFCFYHSGICRTIDLNTKKIIAQFYLPSEAHHGRNHAGVACFSEEFYDGTDEFPLLYLSSYQEYKCYVFRMNRTGAELVQSIYTYENEGQELAPVLAYEPDGNVLLLKMRDINYHWITINRPDVHASKTVYLNLKDKKDEYEVPSTAAYNAGFAYHGKIYQLAGYKWHDYKLYILDYINKKVLVDEYWNNDILKQYEQEQCSRFKNGLLINYNYSDQLVYVEMSNWIF